MRIHNCRIGFATNSSSTHSIIFQKEPKAVADNYDLRPMFGWQYFLLASEQAKLDYLAATLFENLMDCLDDNRDIAEAVVKDWLPERENTSTDFGVDHQSQICLPADFNKKHPSKKFFLSLKKEFVKDNYFIYGGNDNDDQGQDIPSGSEGFFLSPLLDSDGWVCRYDEKFAFWTLFNMRYGTKLRIRFGEQQEVSVEKASTPELVDLKITDYCESNCAYCYQGSSKQGKHADIEFLQNVLFSLSCMQVFEIAIGGGEPTKHPDFVKILRECWYYGIVPNFSTRDLSWVQNPTIVEAVKEHCGGFAVSVSSYDEYKTAVNTLYPQFKFEMDRISFQMVLGTFTKKDFERIMSFNYRKENCNNAIFSGFTFLGYKKTGRGCDFVPFAYDWWLPTLKKILEKNLYLRIGVDTCVVEEFEEQLLGLGVDKKYFTKGEGKFSAYIDCVAGKFGPSSYCNQSQMTEMQMQPVHGYHRFNQKTFLQKFKTY